MIENFSKVAGYKINAHKSSSFPFISNTLQQQELERKFHSKSPGKYKILRNLSAKTNTGITQTHLQNTFHTIKTRYKQMEKC